ncbi:hypothetical protein LWF15_03570 [Kineosporia rhizophila]|uniref:hypothetical protein n=1 Tax=Kineosporia rhizophila TaxID=84633 RepID=UPI001E3C41D5|nr:hypothetical protein [Kineosporia rhizophila]MCE0534577.1 hypothetical protein [Kineosporia rhizophila]
MTPSSSPVTAPMDMVRIVRQGRHAAFEQVSSATEFARPSAPPDRAAVIRERLAGERDQLRRLRRALPDLADRSQRFEIEEEMRVLAGNIRAGRQALERLGALGSASAWGPSDFVPGDDARLGTTWGEVLHIGPAGLTLRLDQSSEQSVEYARITGRRRDGREDVHKA